MSATLVLIGIALCAVSGVPALFSRRTGVTATLLMLAGAATGFAGSLNVFFSSTSSVSLAWQVPIGAFVVRLDGLSAFFALPVFLLAGTGALYGERHFPITAERGGYVRAFFGLMTGALALVMCAGNTIVFLAAWEIVAVSSFFLIATNHELEESRDAAWIYLAASHVATLALFAIVALLHTLTHRWSFVPLPAGVASTSEGRALFVLALIAFGVKSGLMPLHIWLPGAHAAAPSHVSSLMSGVAIKMGIYGLVRLLSLYDVIPQSYGTILLVAGIASSILGVAFALAQHDLKRLLAYHSIENIGIIVTGLGVGILAQANGLPLLALLGYAGALLHVWNHGLFKALLFLSAGAAIHGTHTRDLDRMGGLAKSMPWSAAAFVIGAVAITGLPPLNGFVSEWLLYVAGFASIIDSPRGAALLLVMVVPALALTGALALACFVKAFGVVFLGAPRTTEARDAHEAPLAMRIAMLPLIGGCLFIGLLPASFASILTRTILGAAPHLPPLPGLADVLRPIQTMALVTAAVAGFAIVVVRIMTRRKTKAPTWDCGYAAPTARMQYTASSTARTLVSFFAWAMPTIVHAPRTFKLFPTEASFESHVPDTVLDRALLPTLRGGRWLLGFARYIQHGRMQLYLVYLGATLLLLLAWSAR